MCVEGLINYLYFLYAIFFYKENWNLIIQSLVVLRPTTALFPDNSLSPCFSTPYYLAPLLSLYAHVCYN